MEREILAESRRHFLKATGLAVAGAKCGAWPQTVLGQEAQPQGVFEVMEARHYEKMPGQRVWCHLCPKECDVGDGERGNCGVRENRKGTYYTLVYANPCSIHADPIEKKPFFHVLPTTQAYSLATAGCNLDCKYCQNWEISQAKPEETQNVHLPPQKAAEQALKEGCRSVAYTYTEPTVFFEYVMDTAKAAKEKGLKNVVVSNGFIMKAPSEAMCDVVDAIKVDFKGFSEEFYKETCEGEMAPVLETLKRIKGKGIWLEIVTLLVPTLNDFEDQIRGLCQWIKDNLGADVPTHFSRFHPTYKLSALYPTPPQTMDRAWRIGKEVGLNFVYVGNMPKHPGENTYCPTCGKTLISRYSYVVKANNIRDGACRFCQTAFWGCGTEWPGRLDRGGRCPMGFPCQRLRRLRTSESIRRLVRESHVSPSDLILPIFLKEGRAIETEVPSMPGQKQVSVDRLEPLVQAATEAGVAGVLLFGIADEKDACGSRAWDEEGAVQRGIRRIRDLAPNLVVITDVCLCAYTDHGHCGLVAENRILNDPTLEFLSKMAVSHGRAGAHLVAPSDMMDGRVGSIRRGLDASGFEEIGILSYAAKYASAFYGPFRDAAESAPQFGDRSTHQMDPSNVREALEEVKLDIEEGADIVMVKPALAYLDVISKVRQAFNQPVAAYSVSGEYAMVKAAAANGWVDERRICLEILTAIRRAGADLIITYWAVEAGHWLQKG